MLVGGVKAWADFRRDYPFADLCLGFGGLTSGLNIIPRAEVGGIPIHIVSATLGAPQMVFPRISSISGPPRDPLSIGGAGADEDLETAVVRALAETFERYATCVLLEDEYIVDTPSNLGEDALDLRTLPQCATDEYESPYCYMRPIEMDSPVRWVRALSLLEGRTVLVPAAMTHLYGRSWVSERFWPQITTGVAAHTDLKKALVTAICEVIERDAIAMTWLMRLELPRLILDEPPPAIYANRMKSIDRGKIQYHFFDATTDLGVPTAYLVQTADDNPNVAQFVNCSTEFSWWDAIGKLVREAAAGRAYLASHSQFPDDLRAFSELSHGAAYMGRPEQRAGFDFLLKGDATRRLSGYPTDSVDTTEQRLAFLMRVFREKGFNIYALDLTTDELRDVGLNVVRVLIPDLVPMTPLHSARFLDHPRLYSYPEAAGFGSRTRADVNTAPQPFA